MADGGSSATSAASLTTAATTTTEASTAAETLPVIDIAPFFGSDAAARASAAAEIATACKRHGFFYVRGHGVPAALVAELEALSRDWFARPVEEKRAIAMSRGGRAWRGSFQVGDELTSGKPDQKEGLYFGQELDAAHPAVVAGTPLHGPNQFPAAPARLRGAVLEYMDAVTRAGHALMEGISESLGLGAAYFADRYTRDPLVLFRIFNYPHLEGPPAGDTPSTADIQWSVGEHTDYGLLTILHFTSPGLQVRGRAGAWIDAPPIPGTFVCNLGDMLERLTRGLYKSTPHRVRNVGGADRLSFPLFFDPNWNAEMHPIHELWGATRGAGSEEGAGSAGDIDEAERDRRERWDHASVHDFSGKYGDYLLRKVGKVFPDLGAEVLP